MNRLWVALGIYAAIALLAWFTLSDNPIRFRSVTLVILALFVIRTLVYNRHQSQSEPRE